MIQKDIRFNAKYGLKKVVPGKAVDLAACIKDFAISTGQTIITNGMDTIDSVGSRIKDNFDAMEEFAGANPSTAGMGYGNESN